MKIKVGVEFGGVHKERIIEISDEEIKDMTKEQQEEYFQELANEFAAEHTWAGWEEVK